MITEQTRVRTIRTMMKVLVLLSISNLLVSLCYGRWNMNRKQCFSSITLRMSPYS